MAAYFWHGDVMLSVSMTSSFGTYYVEATSEVLICLWHCRSLHFASWTVDCMLNLVYLLKKYNNGLFGAARLYCYRYYTTKYFSIGHNGSVWIDVIFRKESTIPDHTWSNSSSSAESGNSQTNKFYRCVFSKHSQEVGHPSIADIGQLWISQIDGSDQWIKL